MEEAGLAVQSHAVVEMPGLGWVLVKETTDPFEYPALEPAYVVQKLGRTDVLQQLKAVVADPSAPLASSLHPPSRRTV